LSFFAEFLAQGTLIAQLAEAPEKWNYEQCPDLDERISTNGIRLAIALAIQ
jgi:hypothetical protein